LALKEYNAEVEDVRQSPYLVVGLLDWSSETVLTKADREMIRSANDSYDQRISGIAKSKYLTAKQASESRESAAAERDRAIRSVRDQAEGRKPKHPVYLLSGDEQILSWKKGEKHRVPGVVQAVSLTDWHRASGMFGLTKREASYLQASFRIKVLGLAGDKIIVSEAKPPTSQPNSPKPENNTELRSMMAMAGNYLSAGRKDLARKEYERIVKAFPNTPEANVAQKILDELTQATTAPATP